MSFATFVLDHKVASLTLLQVFSPVVNVLVYIIAVYSYALYFVRVTYTIVILICIHIVFSLCWVVIVILTRTQLSILFVFSVLCGPFWCTDSVRIIID